MEATYQAGGKIQDLTPGSHPLQHGDGGIALGVARALSGIHRDGVVHKDITPANVIYRRRDRLVRVIDFSLAAQVVREEAEAAHPSALEG
ncbi:MAG: protein kinase, partial [Thiohalorhabdaceae bacterium]